MSARFVFAAFWMALWRNAIAGNNFLVYADKKLPLSQIVKRQLLFIPVIY
jgi:hypothetical protein